MTNYDSLGCHFDFNLRVLVLQLLDYLEEKAIWALAWGTTFFLSPIRIIRYPP